MIIKTSYPFMKPPPSARLIRGHRLAQGLVGCWPMNEAGGLQVADLSEYGNTGALDNTATFISGKFGSAVEIGDGTDGRISCPSFTPLVNDLTMVVWARLDAEKISGVVMDQAGATRCAIRADLPFNARYYDGSFYTVTSSVSQTLGTWNQFVYVKSSVIGAKLYLNGVLVGSEPTHTSNILLPSPAYLCFGSASNTLGNATYTIDGAIDYGLIYNRALSAFEIAELYWRPFCMFERRARTALMSGYEVVAPPVGMAGAMTTNTGYWGW